MSDHLATAEFMVAETLRTGMEDGDYYKDIFKLCKVKLEILAGAVGKRQRMIA